MKTEFNRHKKDFRCDFTIEFEVKNPKIPERISEKLYQWEWETGEFTNLYAQECFEQLQTIAPKVWKMSHWSFAGRSDGWFAVLCEGEQEDVTPLQLQRMENIATKYFKDYGRRIYEFYSEFYPELL